MTTIVYDARDLDGLMCRLIAEKYKGDLPYDSIAWMSFWKDDKERWEQLFQHCVGKSVIMLDCSVTQAQFHTLLKNCKSVLWIDHHASEFEEYMKARTFNDGLTYIYGVDRSASELAWEYFFPNEPAPEIVTCLGAYDVFRKEGGRFHLEEIKAVNLYLTVKWDLVLLAALMDDQTFGYAFSDIVDAGRLLLEFEKKNHARPIASGRLRTWHGYRTLIVNATTTAPGRLAELAFEMDPTLQIVAIWHQKPAFFADKPDLYPVSLRSQSDEVDVAAIAKLYGGGGHTHAAGCVLTEIPK